jgi:hypothetical protein
LCLLVKPTPRGPIECPNRLRLRAMSAFNDGCNSVDLDLVTQRIGRLGEKMK